MKKTRPGLNLDPDLDADRHPDPDPDQDPDLDPDPDPDQDPDQHPDRLPDRDLDQDSDTDPEWDSDQGDFGSVGRAADLYAKVAGSTPVVKGRKRERGMREWRWGVRLLVAKETIPHAKYTDRSTPRNRTEQVHHPVTYQQVVGPCYIHTYGDPDKDLKNIKFKKKAENFKKT